MPISLYFELLIKQTGFFRRKQPDSMLNFQIGGLPFVKRSSQKNSCFCYTTLSHNIQWLPRKGFGSAGCVHNDGYIVYLVSQ